MHRSFLFGLWLVFAIPYFILVAYLARAVLVPPKTVEARVKVAPISNLESYFDQKGHLETDRTISYATLAQTPVDVLGATSSASPSAVPSINKINKSTITMAILGDSMVDTLGPTIPHLAQELKERFPKIQFKLLNYGAGATNIEYGLSRLTDDYTYLGEVKPALLSLNPDIVVVESFAYNHWSNTQGDLDRQWLTIAKIIDTIKSRNPKTVIVLAATIAPNCPTYTDGSANLSTERKFNQCATVKAYLQNMVNFATSQGYPLADAYHSSLNGTEGDPKYINQGDHIHASDDGKILFAQKVADAIKGAIPE